MWSGEKSVNTQQISQWCQIQWQYADTLHQQNLFRISRIELLKDLRRKKEAINNHKQKVTRLCPFCTCAEKYYTWVQFCSISEF